MRCGLLETDESVTMRRVLACADPGGVVVGLALDVKALLVIEHSKDVTVSFVIAQASLR